MGKGFEKLAAANKAGRHLCVGLDPDFSHARTVINGSQGYGLSDRLISDADYAIPYMGSVIRRTGRYAAAFKFNFEFWCTLEYNFELLVSLKALIERARSDFPDAVIILDRKYGDIGNTSKRSAEFAKKLGADIVTVNPYMGIADVTREFNKLDIDCFVLGRTSNEGANELQSLLVGNDTLLSDYVGSKAQLMGHGLVVGATNTTMLENLSFMASKAPFLIPGVGAQGGDLELVVKAMRAHHKAPWVVNVGRGIAEASKNPETWLADVEAAALMYHDAMVPIVKDE